MEMRGQIHRLRQIVSGLGVGLVLAIIVIFLLLTANFQSLAAGTDDRLNGASRADWRRRHACWLTGTTLNIQSFIGAIMAIGVAMANAILLVTFAEHERHLGLSSREAAVRARAGVCGRS